MISDLNEANNNSKAETDRMDSEKKSENDNKETIGTDTQADLFAELSEAKNKAKENFELMLRSKADLENYKKRSAREMNDLRKYALESIIKEFLNVVDNLERAMQSIKDNNKNMEIIVKGIDLTLNEMMKILENNDVSPIKSIGKPFDPKIHQAMSQQETSKHATNIVIKEFLKGYLIHDRLLRPAMVVVSKSTKEDESDL